jgi:hypothetical protein
MCGLYFNPDQHAIRRVRAGGGCCKLRWRGSKFGRILFRQRKFRGIRILFRRSRTLRWPFL